MRPLLVLDTCGHTGYVAIVDAAADGHPLLAEHMMPARETQEGLLPAIAASLRHAHLAAADLAAIAVVTGPGSFTGVRIGLAAAKGLAEAALLPLIACSRLCVLAQTYPAAGPVTAWLDAGRNDVYAGLYTVQPGTPPLLQQEEMLPRDTAAAIVQGPLVLAEPTLATNLPHARLVTGPQLQQATLQLAASLFHAQSFADPALLDANYLRVPDAELALRARLAAVR